MRQVSKVLILTLFLFVSVVGAFAQQEAEQRFNVAANAFSDGFYDASLSLFKKFKEEFPESLLIDKANLYIAKCYYQKQDYRPALKILVDLESSKTKDIVDEAYYLTAIIHFKGKNFAKALSYAKKIMKDQPDSEFIWEVHYLKAGIDLESGRLEQAREGFKKIIDNSQSPELINNSYSKLLKLYFQDKKYSQIISLCTDYERKFPKGELKAEVQFYLGESYYAQGNWARALRSYLHAKDSSQTSDIRDLIYQGIGFTYIEIGERNEAKVNIDKIADKQLRLFSQGIYYFKTTDYIQALETFNIFIRDYDQSPLLPEAYLNKADILYEMGRINDSIYVYQYILGNFTEPDHIDTVNKAHYGLAWCYLKGGKFKNAIEEFESTLEYADNPVVKVSSQIQIADAYQETAKYEEALSIYNEILESQPSTVYADYIQFQIGMIFLKKKDLEKSFLALRTLENNFPSSRLIPQVKYYLAVGYFSQDNYVQAKSLLESFIEKFPQDDLIAKVHYLYGKCFFNEGDYEQALTIFKRMIGRFKNSDIEELVYIDMGNAYLNLKLYSNAKKTWNDFLKRYPDSQYSATVLLYLAGLYEKEKKYFEAQKYYQQVLSDYKGSVFSQEALLSLGHLYWSKGDLLKAQECFEGLVGKDSSFALKAKLYLAKILKQQNKSEKALELYNQLIKLESPVSKIALVDKAFLLKEMKNYKDAISNFKKAIAVGIDTAELRFSLGLCLEKTGRDQEAVEELLKVIYAFSEDKRGSTSDTDKNYKIKSYFRIARIYEKIGNIEAAKKTYKKIIDLGVEEAKIASVRLAELNDK